MTAAAAMMSTTGVSAERTTSGLLCSTSGTVLLDREQLKDHYNSGGIVPRSHAALCLSGARGARRSLHAPARTSGLRHRMTRFSGFTCTCRPPPLQPETQGCWPAPCHPRVV